MKNKKINKVKKVLLSLIVIIFVLIITEVMLRFFVNDTYIFDNRYGWNMDHPGIFYENVEDTPGNTRQIMNQYFDNGFKRWPNVSKSKPNILIIGDSFTQMQYVSNGEEWYSYLERKFPDYDFYVYGQGAYGTLQEYLIVDEYIDQINPEIIILQFHFNDFINNYYPASKIDYLGNGPCARPFLIDDKFQFMLASNFESLRKRSYLARYFFRVVYRIRNNIIQNNIEAYMDKVYGKNLTSLNVSDYNMFEGNFEAAFNTTKTLIKLIKARSGNTQIYIFHAGCTGESEIQRVAIESGTRYIPNASYIVCNIP